MKCKFEKCVNHQDCVILDITGKEPKSFESCSYSKTPEKAAKQKERLNKPVEKPKRKKKS